MTGRLGLLLVLLSGLVAQYYIIRQSNQRLSVQNGIITTNSQQLANQADQVRILRKELHHRIKNNLAIVSSLLKRQSNRLDDEKAIQAVRVGQQRVEAMSLIHQRLYQTDTVTTVNRRDYLTDLAQRLLLAYDYQPTEFDLQLNIEQQHVDMAMPLGLIVNELATNAFKYAYTNLVDQRPMLRIDLRPQAHHLCPTILMEVQDNGPGIDQSEWQKKGAKTSVGKRLIASLSEQLEGEFELLKQNGTLFRLQIPRIHAQAKSQVVWVITSTHRYPCVIWYS